MSSHIKDMNDSHTEALQALFNSLAPKGLDTSPSSKLTPTQLKHLANKIDEILGGASNGEGLQRNEKGQLLNEEGLPIIDITEPAVDLNEVYYPAAPFHEPDLIPESFLSASEREQRRRTRERILAMLEEEERSQLERDEAEEREKPHGSSAMRGGQTAGSSVDQGRHPMKMHVVERHPASHQSLSRFQPEGDSDDEPLSTTSSTPSKVGNMPHKFYASDSDDDESDEGLLEEEFDWDSAQHHREVALEYYKKRHVIGAEAARAMTSHTHDDEEWNQSDITPNHRPKPSVSRFRADRMAMAYDKSASTSLGPSNNHLVGGEEGESGSEDEAVREVLELLSNGHIYNTGPGVMHSTATELLSAGSARSAADTVTGVLEGRVSRFKAERM
ncbi:hypothetical protein EDD22DRAFT_891753 [Suillus occidentalis]|nr:hypothetical protein EDD22DRAFT_891753 [Suillus occidentalis]